MPRRSPSLRRSWLFLPGADAAALEAGPGSGADVLIQELEDFTPPERRPAARALAQGLYSRWRQAGTLAAVRVNPLEQDGEDDLAIVMRGAPDIVMLPKVAGPEQILRLDQAIGGHESVLGIAAGSTEIVPNIESALGLTRLMAIAAASPRVSACLVASEDMAADLGVERTREGFELGHVRARFALECRAANVVAIDCPYTFSDDAGLQAEAAVARKLGFTAKSLVRPTHAALVNAAFTPSAEQIAQARRLVAAFEAARAGGAERAELDGHLVEVPTYNGAKRLLQRARDFGLL